MNPVKNSARCSGCLWSRRHFLGAGAMLPLAAQCLVQEASAAAKMRIRVIYSLHGPQQKVPDWPNIGFDFVPVMEKFNNALSRRFPRMAFLPTLATGEEQAKKILSDDQSNPVDGYIVFQMNCWNKVVQTMATSGKPVLYVDYPFAGSGGFLVYSARFLREKTANVGFIASSQLEDLFAAVKCFENAKKRGTAAGFADAVAHVRVKHTAKAGDLTCLPDALQPLSAQECARQIKQAKILAVRGTDSGPAPAMLTVPVVPVSFSEVNEAWAAADKDESRAIADLWQNSATLVEGVSRETLEQSAAMYLAEKAVMKKYDANAITINCLGGFYGGHIHAYPCLGFHQLANEGLIGGCECDVRSAAAMVTLTALTKGRPGYISDPVIDTAKRQIIYAHCVASNRVFGPTGPANPFQILTHSEDRQGASVRSVMPVGYLTTTIEIQPDRNEILMHQAKAVDNDPDDRACRTKLAAEPIGDMEKLFAYWDQFSWHRVTCYGDLKESIYALADELGWKVVEEA